MPHSLDPQLVRDYSTLAKKQLRTRMKALRKGYGAKLLQEKSAALVQRLLALPELAEARGVALFWPIVERGEVDLRPLDQKLRESQLAVYYPFMDPKEDGGYRTGFRLTRDSADLRDRGRGFLEPKEGPAARPGEVDLVFVPALAVDPAGRRIGYGAGYYDATLPDVCPPALSIIVAYQFQALAELPEEPHDLRGDLVVTEERTYRASPPKSD